MRALPQRLPGFEKSAAAARQNLCAFLCGDEDDLTDAAYFSSSLNSREDQRLLLNETGEWAVMPLGNGHTMRWLYLGWFDSDGRLMRLDRKEKSVVKAGGFTEAERQRAKLGLRAHNKAVKRLVRAHQNDFKEILNEERAKLGLPAKTEAMSIREMRRLAELALEAEMSEDLPKFLTPIETAEVLRISYSTVRKLVATGEIRAVWVGHSMRIPVVEVERLARGAAAA